MFDIWERLFKKIIWQQLGEIKGKRILDFGSGEGITADHFAGENEVSAIEPSQEMLSKAWKDHVYTQIVGDLSALAAFPDGAVDVVLCHNVLEYIDENRFAKFFFKILLFFKNIFVGLLCKQLGKGFFIVL